MSTLQPDIDASITWWFYYYIFCNVVNVISIVIVIVGPLLSAWGVYPRTWGILSAVCGAALAYFGLGGVANNFITARNDLRVAKYHYYADNDRDKLIAAYKDAMNRGRRAPPAQGGSQRLDPSSGHPRRKPRGA